jgi:hypothetical protein
MNSGAMKTEAQTNAARIQMPACASIAVPISLLASVSRQICYQPRTKLYCSPSAVWEASPGPPRRGSSSPAMVVGSCSGMPVADAMIVRIEKRSGEMFRREMTGLIVGRWCSLGDYDVVIL